MNPLLKQIIDELKRQDSDADKKQWFDEHLSDIIPLLADLASVDRDHFEVVLEDIVDIIGSGKGALRKKIKFNVEATIRKRVNERNKVHFDEDVTFERDPKNGSVNATITNIAIVLMKSRHLPLRYDQFSGKYKYEVYNQYQLPWLNSGDGIRIEYKITHAEKETDSITYYNAMGEYEIAALTHYLQQFFPGETNWRMLPKAIAYAAKQNEINLYQDYFRYGLPEWDGVDRFDFMHRFAGVKEKAWARVIAKSILVGMIARCFQPGYDYRGIVILEGGQKIGKSWLCEHLSFHPDFHTKFSFDKHNNNYEQTRQLNGMAVVEFPDMGGISSRDVNYVKAFFTATHDRNRRMQQNEVEHIKRNGIFIITANSFGPYLSDPTGNSRYLPCPCETDWIEGDKIVAELPQLFAQAYRMWRDGISPNLTPEETIIQERYLKPRETKPDYFHSVLLQLKLHSDQITHEWDDGFKTDEMIQWVTSMDTWSNKTLSNKDRGEIIHIIKHYFKFEMIAKRTPILSISPEKPETIKQWRYKGETNWFAFINSFDDD